eukprot:1820244-Prymnesium_polylepis.1
MPLLPSSRLQRECCVLPPLPSKRTRRVRSRVPLRRTAPSRALGRNQLRDAPPRAVARQPAVVRARGRVAGVRVQRAHRIDRRSDEGSTDRVVDCERGGASISCELWPSRGVASSCAHRSFARAGHDAARQGAWAVRSPGEESSLAGCTFDPHSRAPPTRRVAQPPRCRSWRRRRTAICRRAAATAVQQQRRCIGGERAKGRARGLSRGGWRHLQRARCQVLGARAREPPAALGGPGEERVVEAAREQARHHLGVAADHTDRARVAQ